MVQYQNENYKKNNAPFQVNNNNRGGIGNEDVQIDYDINTIKAEEEMREKLTQLGNEYYNSLAEENQNEIAKLFINDRPNGGYADFDAIHSGLELAIETYENLLNYVNESQSEGDMKTALHNIGQILSLEVTDWQAGIMLNNRTENGYNSISEIITSLPTVSGKKNDDNTIQLTFTGVSEDFGSLQNEMILEDITTLKFDGNEVEKANYSFSSPSKVAEGTYSVNLTIQDVNITKGPIELTFSGAPKHIDTVEPASTVMIK